MKLKNKIVILSFLIASCQDNKPKEAQKIQQEEELQYYSSASSYSVNQLQDDIPNFPALDWEQSVTCIDMEEQYEENESEKWVLNRQKIGKTYCFKKRRQKNETQHYTERQGKRTLSKTRNVTKYYDEIHQITYLGTCKQNNGKTIKILTEYSYQSSFINEKASISIYEKGKKIGYYEVNSKEDLPKKFISNKLIFNNLYNGCNPKLFKKVSFLNNLPKSIKLDCIKKGDSSNEILFLEN